MEETARRLDRTKAAAPIWVWLAGLPAAALALVAAATPASASDQFWLAVATLLLLLILHRVPSRFISVLLAVLSATVSARYLFWRATETLHFDSVAESLLGTGLFLAELYAFVVLSLGFLLSVWPLERRPTPLPEDVEQWPTVDVLIPTAAEPLEVVAPTVHAALSMDYPVDKVRVHLLDDGARPEFAAFAEAAGATYVTHGEDAGAKASDLNQALARTDADLFAVFDAGCPPTRAFLQLTVGAFLADERLAVVQTPRHERTPDPYRRNLAGGEKIPGETQLFYGVTHPGADTWGGAFFCGSGGVLRRSALDEVGGFAEDAATDGALTAIRLHRAGWNSHYLPIPLSAGKAAENLERHIDQRRRWGQGMLRILRLEGPLSGVGLTHGQRLAYLNAMLRYVFPLPRLAFLLAPLAYLLFGQNVIAADWRMLLLFGLPHLIHALVTNARLRSRHRHAFWGGIHETSQAFHMVRPTLTALADPSGARVSATPSRGKSDRPFLDRGRATPLIVCALALLAALAYGAVRLAAQDMSAATGSAGMLGVYMAWAALSLMAVLGALAVTRERPAREANEPMKGDATANLTFGGGKTTTATVSSLGMDGLRAAAEDAFAYAAGESVHMALDVDGRRLEIGGEIAGTGPRTLDIRFGPLDMEQQRLLAQFVFGRADAWIDWDAQPKGSILRSLLRIFVGIAGMFFNFRRGRSVASLAALVLVFAAASPAMADGHASAGATTLTQPPAPGDYPPERLPLVGATNMLTAMMPKLALSVPVRADRLVDAGQLVLTFDHDAGLPEALRRLDIRFNGASVRRIALTGEATTGRSVTVALDATKFQRSNTIEIAADRRGAACGWPPETLPAVRVNLAASHIEASMRPLRLKDDLALLPWPFVDANDASPARIDFVFAGPPGDRELEAAAAIASYFGAAAGRDGLDLQARFGETGEANAVVFVAGGGGTLDAGEAAGKNRIYLRPNHKNPYGAKLLVLTGADPERLRMTARHAALAGIAKALQGEIADVAAAPTLPERQADDARRWIPLDRPANLSDIVRDPATLWASGPQGRIAVEFATPPRRIPAGRPGPTLRAAFDLPATADVDAGRSGIDVLFDGDLQAALPLANAGAIDGLAKTIRGADGVDAAYGVRLDGAHAASNHRLAFDVRLAPSAAACAEGAAGPDLRLQALPTTAIDFSDAALEATLPDIGFFAEAGYPFTRMADLSETVVVVPSDPTPDDIAAFLTLMAHVGARTGDAAVQVSVMRADSINDAPADADLLAVGAWSGIAPVIEHWGRAGPFEMADGALRVAAAGPLETVNRMVGDDGGDRDLATAMLAVDGAGFAGVASFERPGALGRTVLILTDADPAGALAMAKRLTAPEPRGAIGGDLIRWSPNDGFQSYAVGGRYDMAPAAGDWRRWRYLLAQHPLALIAGLLAGVALLSTALFLLLKRIAAARLSLGDS